MAVKKEIPFKLEKETKKVGAKVLPRTNAQRLEEENKKLNKLNVSEEQLKGWLNQTQVNKAETVGRIKLLKEIINE